MKRLFLKEPKPVDQAAYTACIERFVAKFHKIPGLLAIYQYGGVSAPGISDLDLMLVVADDAPALPQNWDGFLTETDRYLLMHSPTAVPWKIFAQSDYFADLQGLKIIWGQPLTPKPLPQSFLPFIRHLTAAEHIVRLLVSCSRQQNLQTYKLRPSLCELHSLKYDFALIADFNQPQQSFQRAVAQLRQDWFGMQSSVRQQKLVELIGVAIELQLALLRKLENWACQQTDVHPTANITVSSRWPTVILRTGKRQLTPSWHTHVPATRQWLATLLKLFPSSRMRQVSWLLEQHYISLDHVLLNLLLAHPVALTDALAQALEARWQLGHLYTQFLTQKAPHWGSIWSSIVV